MAGRSSSGNQSPTTTKQGQGTRLQQATRYAETLEAQRRDRERFAQIELDIAERAKYLTRSEPMEWELRRDRDREYQARIKGLERALASSERQLVKARSLIKRQKRRITNESRQADRISEALHASRFLTLVQVHQRLEEEGHTMSIETIRRTLHKMVEAGQAELIRSEDGGPHKFRRGE